MHVFKDQKFLEFSCIFKTNSGCKECLAALQRDDGFE